MTTDFVAPAGHRAAELVRAQPQLRLRSNEVADGGRLLRAQCSGRRDGGDSDVSPSLLWSGAPIGTLSYVVTAHDQNGRCHWAVADISGGVTSLVVDAGNGRGERLPSVARQLRNDLGVARYIGPSPERPGRLEFSVHAVDVGRLGLSTSAGPAELAAILGFHRMATETLTVYG